MAANPFANFLSILSPARPNSSQFPPFTSHTPSQTPPPPSSSSLSFPLGRKQQQDEIQGVEGCSSSSSSELTAVMCPSLAYANTLYFRSAYNVQVVVEDGEPEERLLNRFRREVMKAGVIQEVKRRRYFENKQDEQKRRSRDAAKRNSRKRRPQFRAGGPPQAQDESSKAAEKKEDEDNWEMPDGEDIPY